MVAYKEHWQQANKSGLSMALLETKDDEVNSVYNGLLVYNNVRWLSRGNVLQRFVDCLEEIRLFLQNEGKVEEYPELLDAVESLNPDTIVSIINDYPYHVNALIQTSDLCKLSEDLAMAAELIEQALALYVAMFKHLAFLGGRACNRTALEFCKLLLSLDPEGDPVAVKLSIDFYALRAKEYQWLVDFVEQSDIRFYLMQLPNFSFSVAMARFYLGDVVKANDLLQDALLMFPQALMPLLEKCSIQIDKRVSQHSFFTMPDEKNTPKALAPLITLFVSRNCHIWKDAVLLPWLEKNVHNVLDRVDQNDPIVQDYFEKRMRRFSGPIPLSIARHIILSDEHKGLQLTVRNSYLF
ncbi:hypothetical protein HUJ05_008721 [Dendroctonus ponderosae]|nr:hypothetical protein HUJ05_008721 [Dendroctonus ponderosae]